MFLLDQFIGRLVVVTDMSIYINIQRREKSEMEREIIRCIFDLLFGFFFSFLYLKNRFNTLIVLSCVVLASLVILLSPFFLLNQKKKRRKARERIGSRLSTNDVRGRPSSWSFAFCPPTQKKKERKENSIAAAAATSRFLHFFLFLSI